ncbi:MAG TPA: outer membrane protein assembly factor BamA [Candidatus Binatia bacterium]|jgi:outer membrane protein insertion porin family
MRIKPALIRVLFFAPVILLTLGVGFAQEKVKLSEVKIAGNLRVEEEGIRLHLKSRAGDTYDPAVVEQDVKAIYRMGFFDDVQAELSQGVLTYSVKEKPYVREVKIQGNSQVSRDKIETALGVAQRTILDRSKVAEGVDKVKKLYVEQGYVNAVVDYAVSVESNNQAIVALDINEGNRLLIKKISFEGNRAFGESELKGLMTTKEEWLFSFITNRGVLDRDILSNDMAILANHYYDHGYIDHKIDEPLIVRARDGLEVVIRVNEGDQYRIGQVSLGGDLIKDGKEMLKDVKITSGQIFRGSRLREDITTLTDMYSNKGFAFAQVEPLTKVNPTEKNVDITLVVTRGPPVYFNRVLIAGNSKTRDKVVRRELLATEQELFSGTKITQSRNALQRTGYFEDVQLTTKKTDQPDTVDLQVDVKEGPTGTFTVGAGYSSGDGFIFNTSISEKNLFGRGQALSGTFALGTKRQDYVLSFNEPYFNDSNVSTGLELYNTKREYSNFDEKKLGFGVNTSYPLRDAYIPFVKPRRTTPTPGSDDLATAQPITMWDFMRGGISYDLTRESISGVQVGAPQSIVESKGTSLTSAMTPNISYDSRDHFFNTTEGTKSAFSTQFAGLGGDNRYIKSDISARWYYPLLKDPKWGGSYVLALGGTLGWGVGFGGHGTTANELPLFARYFLGGINSVRGFADRSLGPREQSCTTVDDATSCSTEVIGGDKAMVGNVELLFPILEEYGLRGVAFFDIGNAFNNFNFGDLRRSVGFGGRWMSPFGPLRVELGFPLNKKPGDDTSVLGFTIGSQP